MAEIGEVTLGRAPYSDGDRDRCGLRKMKLKEKIINLLNGNDVDSMKRLIEENRGLIRRTVQARQGLIYWNALYSGISLEMAQLFIAEGIVDLQMTDGKGFNCLAHCRDLDIAQFLIGAGADIHHCNSKNQNITHYLIGDIERQELLQVYNTLLQGHILPDVIMQDEEAFWQIVNRAVKKGLGDEQRIAVEAVLLLQEKAIESIISFELTYRQISTQCFKQEIWDTIFQLQGGCSDDDFLFRQRPWMISLGEEKLQRILRTPEEIGKYWGDNRRRFVNYTNIQCDSLDRVGVTAYTRRTGKSDFEAIVQRYSQFG